MNTRLFPALIITILGFNFSASANPYLPKSGEPPATVRVAVPTCREKAVPFAPDLMALTGTLHLGNRAEADRRVTYARLELDPPTPSFLKRLFSRSNQEAEKQLVRNTTQRTTP